MIDYSRSFDKRPEQRDAGGLWEEGAAVVESGLEEVDLASQKLACRLYNRSNETDNQNRPLPLSSNMSTALPAMPAMPASQPTPAAARGIHIISPHAPTPENRARA